MTPNEVKKAIIIIESLTEYKVKTIDFECSDNDILIWSPSGLRSKAFYATSIVALFDKIYNCYFEFVEGRLQLRIY